MLPATAPFASNYTSSGSAALERIPQLVEENRQLIRKGRKSAAGAAGQKGGQLLLHLEPGVRQAIEGDEVYFVEAKADDTEVRTRGARLLKDLRPMERAARRCELQPAQHESLGSLTPPPATESLR